MPEPAPLAGRPPAVALECPGIQPLVSRQMDRTRLQKLLAELRAELADARDVDSATQESLRQLADELVQLTGEDDGQGSNPRAPENLRELAVRFETGHPRLAAI